MPNWESQAARINHALLYLCLSVMPLSGFAATQFTKYGVNYFGLFKHLVIDRDKVFQRILPGGSRS